MDVRLPDGTVVKNIPEGTTRDQLAQKLTSNGMKVPDEWMSSKTSTEQKPEQGFWDRHFGLVTDLFNAHNIDEAKQSLLDKVTAYGKELSDLGRRNVRYGGGTVTPDKQVVDTPESRKRAEEIKNAVISLSTPPVGRVSEAIGKEFGLIKPNVAAEAISKTIRAGYKAPPSKVADLTGDKSLKMKLSTLLEGLGGSPQLSREMVVSDQANTNRIIRKMLGISEGESITPELLQSIRENQGKIYDALKKKNFPIYTSSQWRNSLKSLEGDISNAVKDFPELHNKDLTSEIRAALNKDSFSIPGLIEEVKSLRYRGSMNLKNWMDPEKRALGLAQKKAAGMLDDLMEKNLNARGMSDTAKAYRNARTNIAQIHDIESSLSDITGDVDARYLARLTKGKTVTGQMKDITDFVKLFSREGRTPALMAGNVPIDRLGGYAMASGKKGIMAVPVLSAGIRKILMSDRFQKWLNDPKGELPPHARAYINNLYKLAATQIGPNENTDRRD